MAKKTDKRLKIKMRSTESAHYYTTMKNRQNTQEKLVLRKYDPILRKHVEYKEDKIK